MSWLWLNICYQYLIVCNRKTLVIRVVDSLTVDDIMLYYLISLFHDINSCLLEAYCSLFHITDPKLQNSVSSQVDWKQRGITLNMCWTAGFQHSTFYNFVLVIFWCCWYGFSESDVYMVQPCKYQPRRHSCPQFCLAHFSSFIFVLFFGPWTYRLFLSLNYRCMGKEV